MVKRTPNAAKVAIRVWLAQHGRTQTWLAQRLKVSEGLLSGLLSGSRLPTDKQVKAIARITGVSLREQPILERTA